MKTMTAALRDADPLQYEREPSEADRAELRRRVIATAVESARRPSTKSRRSFALISAMATILFAGVVLGFQFWRGGMTLHAAVRFEVRLAENEPAPGLVAARVPDSDRVVYLWDEAVVTNDDIDHATIVPGAGSGLFDVQVQFNSDGAQKFWLATSSHDGKPMAILIDGSVVMAPTVRGPVSTPALITGHYTEDEAKRIVDGMTLR